MWGKVNPGKPLLNRRHVQHAKGADRHEPKGTQSGRVAKVSPRADIALPADRRDLNPKSNLDTHSNWLRMRWRWNRCCGMCIRTRCCWKRWSRLTGQPIGKDTGANLRGELGHSLRVTPKRRGNTQVVLPTSSTGIPFPCVQKRPPGTPAPFFCSAVHFGHSLGLPPNQRGSTELVLPPGFALPVSFSPACRRAPRDTDIVLLFRDTLDRIRLSRRKVREIGAFWDTHSNWLRSAAGTPRLRPSGLARPVFFSPAARNEHAGHPRSSIVA